MLTLNLSARSLILDSYQYIKTKFSQKPLGKLNSNFILKKISQYSGTNIYTCSFGHMTKIAVMPINGKNAFKYHFPEPQSGLVCSIWEVNTNKFK